MKIKKFNEKNYFSDHNSYKEYEDSYYIALLFYDVGGTVKESILFDNEIDLQNYILNYVNQFILDDNVNEQDDEYISDWKSLKRDSRGDLLFTNWEEAHEWYNLFNESTEPTFTYVKCGVAKNIKIEDRELSISSKKYNL